MGTVPLETMPLGTMPTEVTTLEAMLLGAAGAIPVGAMTIGALPDEPAIGRTLSSCCRVVLGPCSCTILPLRIVRFSSPACFLACNSSRSRFPSSRSFLVRSGVTNTRFHLVRYLSWGANFRISALVSEFSRQTIKSLGFPSNFLPTLNVLVGRTTRLRPSLMTSMNSFRS